MEKKIDAIRDLQQKLIECNNPELSMVLSNVVDRQSEKKFHTIGFMGDDLVGKSTVINSVLCEEILPTTIVPSTAETTIQYGNENAIYDINGSLIEHAELSELLEEEKFLTVSTRNEFLDENFLIFKEFHGLLSKSKLNDMNIMSEVYKCDAVVLIMTAEHLLSESEVSFIDNYIKYVGIDHILLVVNKLSMVDASDISHVLEYTKNLIATKFGAVKWTVFDPSGRYDELIKKYTLLDLKIEMLSLSDKNSIDDEIAVNNVLMYVKDQLKLQCLQLEAQEQKSEEEISKEKEKLKKQKALDDATINETLLELQKRRNQTIELTDKYVKAQFEDIMSKILDNFDKAPDKYSWYRDELETVWRALTQSASENIDKYILSEIEKDIDWLNELFKTGLNTTPVFTSVPLCSPHGTSGNCTYSTCKKFAKIGIAGGVVIGYYFFRIIGAVVGLTGGFLVYSYFGARDSQQASEIRRKLSSQIRDISVGTRQILKNEIEGTYNKVFVEFQKEAKEMLNIKYSASYDNNDTSNRDRIQKLKNLINDCKEI